MNILKKGDVGPYVEMLGLALKRAGYNAIIGEGFDDALENELKSFQANEGLTADGIAGVNTQKRLEPYLLGYKTDSNGAITQLDFDIVPTDIRYTWRLVSYIVKGLSVRYGFTETGSIGKSIMGNDLYYLKIGNGADELMFNGTHHGNEWITTPLLLKFFEEYAKAYSMGQSIGDIPAIELFSKNTLYIIPCVNPDGMDTVNGGLPVGEFYNNTLAISKNYPQIPYPNGWKANVAGVDLNLNYPAGWNRAKENKYSLGFTSPAPRDFVGPEPLSEPESLAMYNFTLSHNFLLTISYHTQGKVIYWKYLDYLPPRSYSIATELADASGYSLSVTPKESAYAGFKDWFIQAFQRPGYTVEAGLGENPLPLSQFDEIYGNNLPLLTKVLEII